MHDRFYNISSNQLLEIIEGNGNNSVILGDIDGNYDVNVADIVLLVGQILGINELTDNQIVLGDLNGDGIINIVDIINLVSIILGI